MTERPLPVGRRLRKHLRRGSHRVRPAVTELESRNQPAAHGLAANLGLSIEAAAPAVAAVPARLGMVADTAALVVNVVEEVHVSSIVATPHGLALGLVFQTELQLVEPAEAAVGLRGGDDVPLIVEIVPTAVASLPPPAPRGEAPPTDQPTPHPIKA